MESLDFGIKKCLLRSFFNDTITPWIVRDQVQLLINRIYISCITNFGISFENLV